ncbi:MAG: glycoside hydrolase family 3 protein [Marmoricola sp.]|nr:glycoside hydrolase family 3 protein [Marmoricola sp.]
MVGQLFMTYVYGASATSATPAQRAANVALYGVPTGAQVVRRWHLGGIILIGYNNLDPARPTLASDNVDNAAQITALTRGLQEAATQDGGPPLLVSTDQEGGRVQRITSGVSPRPSQRALASVGRGALECGYVHLGEQLRVLGVNQDLAPDADVVTTASGVIGDRSFGPDPGLDATDVTAAVTGLQGAGVLATLKHWPGHGSTSTDSHLQLAVVHESQSTWHGLDRVPFARAAPLAAAIMVGHLALPAIDPSGAAATFSPILTQGLLRDQLGYRGLIISDSLWMKPARDGGTPGQVASRILTAGIDMMLEPPDLPGAYASVLHAVRTRPTFRARVQDAVQHVLAAKQQVARAPSRPASC